jgi:hypothetical protein
LAKVGLQHLWYLLPLLPQLTSCGNVIYGTSTIYLATYTIVGSYHTTIGITNGSTWYLIIFYAFAFMLVYSLFTHELDALPSSILFLLLRALLGESIVAFFLFSNVMYISSLVFLTLVDGFYGFSF